MVHIFGQIIMLCKQAVSNFMQMVQQKLQDHATKVAKAGIYVFPCLADNCIRFLKFGVQICKDATAKWQIIN